MKRTDLITLLLCIFMIGVALLVVRCPRTVPYEQCSEVYKRYSKVEGVRATYIKDFRVNDTLTVGVTLLEATDSAGWEHLLNSFNALQEVRDDVDTCTQMGKTLVRLAPKGRPEERIGTPEQGNRFNKEQKYDMVMTSYDIKAIGVFHTNSMEEILAVQFYNYDYMTNKTNQYIK